MHLKYLCLLWLLSFSIAAAKLHAQTRNDVLFGKESVQYPLETGRFSKWDDMTTQWQQHHGFTIDACEPGMFEVCMFNDLQDFMQQLQREDAWQQLQEVNAFVNQVPYFEDRQIYGVEDHWAIPQELFEHNAGDCEDFSIAKYLVLKKLGFAINDLKVAIVEDINVSKNSTHAVLVVHYQGEDYVLDNKDYAVVQTQKIAHYRPIYAINEESWWLFKD